MNKASKGCVKGLTFIEVLLAVVILSVAIVPIMNWVPLSMQTRRKVERKTMAVFLAQGKMEELRNKILDKFNPNYKEDSVSFPNPYSSFFYSITDDKDSRFKTVSVKVWQVEAPQDAVTFYTQVARR